MLASVVVFFCLFFEGMLVVYQIICNLSSVDFFRAIFFGVVRVSFHFSAQVLVSQEGRGPGDTL